MNGPAEAPETRTRFRASTDDRLAVNRFVAQGKVSGHSVGAWLPAPGQWAPAPAEVDAVSGRPQPVVAILDTEIRSHSSLTKDDQNIWLTDPGPTESFAPGTSTPSCGHNAAGHCYGSHFGHSTFLAGVVRREAPGAALLPYHVLDDDGGADDEQVLAALRQLASTELHDFLAGQNARLAVVLLAFGRSGAANEPEILELRTAIKALADLGVDTVVAAGNDGTDELHYPAALASEPDLSVTAVGALVGAGPDRAPFSNHGDWVTEWRCGTYVFGPMPLIVLEPFAGTTDDPDSVMVDKADNYAWWSGTSFAAAQYAGELARDAAHDGDSTIVMPSAEVLVEGS